MTLSGVITVKGRQLAWEQKNDNSVECLQQLSFHNWSMINRWYKGFSRLPVPEEWKAKMKHDFFCTLDSYVFRIRQPLIVTYLWPDGQTRKLLITRTGWLFEPNSSAPWDKCLPFCGCDESGTINRVLAGNAKYTRLHEEVAWMPESSNYTHFMFDTFAPLTLLENMGLEPIAAYYYGQLGWQMEMLRKLKKARVFHRRWERSSIMRIDEPDSVIFPAIPNMCVATEIARRFLHQTYGIAEAGRPNESVIAILIRSDYRSERISNINEISEHLRSRFNIVHIDPAKLTIEEKFKVFRNISVCIGESSSLQNPALFGSYECRIVYLAAPNGLEDDIFINGGWPNHQNYAHRSRYIKGRRVYEIEGSPLPACSFDKFEIEHAVRESLEEQNLESKY